MVCSRVETKSFETNEVRGCQVRLISVLVLALFTLSFAACKSREFNMSETNARVTQDQFDKALDLLSNSPLMTDGIPFEFAENGCWARAHLMGALLASEGIPSSSHFVFSETPSDLERDTKRDPSFYVEKPDGRIIRWRYHVAPLVKPPEGPAIVFDPSLFGKGRMTFTAAQWRTSFMRQADPVTRVFPTRLCRTITVPSSVYLYRSGDSHRCQDEPGTDSTPEMVSSFSEMPLFKVSDLSMSCTILRTAYQTDRMLSFQPAPMGNERILRIDTLEIVKKLAYLGKLRGSVSDFNCPVDTDLMREWDRIHPL
jgi:hypothetical protein